MTSLTNADIKTVYFGIIFFILIGVFVSLYNSSPITEQKYNGENRVSNQTSSGSSDWISSLVSGLPAPFDDVNTLIVISVFVTPVSIMLSYIAVRAIKDLLTQWL